MIDAVQWRVIPSCSNSESLPAKASHWSLARAMSLLASNFNLGESETQMKPYRVW